MGHMPWDRSWKRREKARAKRAWRADASVLVERASDEDLRVAVQRLLDDAGVTLEELRDQASIGRFSSDRARIAWAVVADIVDGVGAAVAG